MVRFLVTAQYETAIVKDYRAIQTVLYKFPGSVVYFNADTRMPAGTLDQVLKTILSSKEKHGADVGLLSYNSDPDQARRYLLDIGITCGYITLNIGFEKSARIIIKALEAAEARGDRRFVRVRVPRGKASLNIITKTDGRPLSGTILDISEVGMACILDADYSVGTVFPDVQLRLWGSLCNVSATIAGRRETPQGRVSVLLFDKITDGDVRGKVYSFLQRVMQHEVDALL